MRSSSIFNQSSTCCIYWFIIPSWKTQSCCLRYPLSLQFSKSIASITLQKKLNKSTFSIPHPIIHDSLLWLKFLYYSHFGISINLMIERQSNYMSIAYSCENGICGFSLTTCVAIRYELLDHLKGIISNNSLHHMSEIVAIWLGLLNHEITSLDCASDCADRTSAIGQTSESNFICYHQTHLHLIFYLASLVIENHIYTCSQYIKWV